MVIVPNISGRLHPSLPQPWLGGPTTVTVRTNNQTCHCQCHTTIVTRLSWLDRRWVRTPDMVGVMIVLGMYSQTTWIRPCSLQVDPATCSGVWTYLHPSTCRKSMTLWRWGNRAEVLLQEETIDGFNEYNFTEEKLTSTRVSTYRDPE